MKKILVVFGTRPEAIKMVPVIKTLYTYSGFEVKICVTAQHREMLDQVLDLFEIVPDYDLNIMRSHQDLYDISANIVLGMKTVLYDMRPDLVLVHGDTSTTSMASLAAFYQKIPVGHIEAGLRTYNIYSPWPEEANRRIVAVLAQYHFAPTAKSRDNLLKENIPDSNILVTGNTVIDMLSLVLQQIESVPEIKKKILKTIKMHYPLQHKRRFILVTGHRRENFGEGFIHICEAIKTLALNNPDIDIVYPVHLNPNVQTPVKKLLSGIPNIYLLDPLDYEVFIYLMDKAYLVLTDSGGIQEEAPGLGKPVLVMRDDTERPEAVDAGTVKLVGTQSQEIINEVQHLLDDKKVYERMSKAHNPYGDGKASERIVSFLSEHI